MTNTKSITQNSSVCDKLHDKLLSETCISIAQDQSIYWEPYMVDVSRKKHGSNGIKFISHLKKYVTKKKVNPKWLILRYI